MGRWTVQHAYTARRDGTTFGPWAAGDVVDLDLADAGWVNRDSPGCLKVIVGEAGPAPVPTERQKPTSRDRQHRGGANRSGS